MIPPLLLITDRRNCVLPLEETIRQALAAGCRWIMLREKDLPPEEQIALAAQMKKLCDAFDAALTVNGDTQAANLTGSIHVQTVEAIAAYRKDFARIGFSAHSIEDVARAKDAGADYVTLSPIFRSISKPGYDKVLGVEALAEAAAQDIPVVALGGITPGNAAACIRAGAASVAVMGSVMQSETPGQIIRQLIPTSISNREA